jgi:hypothetical protein
MLSVDIEKGKISIDILGASVCMRFEKLGKKNLIHSRQLAY